MRKRFLVLLTVALALASLQSIATAAVKPGTKCTKLGQTSTSAGFKYTCIKSGKNLVWDKGVAVKAAAKPDLNPVFKPAEPTPIATPTITPNPDTTNQSKVLLSQDPRITPLSNLSSLDICKTTDQTPEYGNSGIAEYKNGFPRPSKAFTDKKQAKILVIPMSFKDLPFDVEKIQNGKSVTSDLGIINDVIPQVRDIVKKISLGRFEVNIDVLPQSDWWIIPSNQPFTSEWGAPNFPKVFDIINKEKPDFKFDGYDSYVFLASYGSGGLRGPGTASAAFNHPVKNSISGTLNGVFMNGRFNEPGVWVHELGHSLFDLEDLYLYSNPDMGPSAVVSIPLNWEIMANASHLESLAWNRLLMGWLDDTQMRCLSDQQSSVHYLTDFVSNGNAKFLAINLAPGVTMAAEARSSTYLGGSLQPGLLLYTINTYLGGGEGPILTQNSLLSKGQTKAMLGWEITVLDSDNDGVLISVKKTDIDKFVPPPPKPVQNNPTKPTSPIKVGKGEVVPNGFLKGRATWEVTGHQSYRLYVTDVVDFQKVYFESGYINDSRTPLVVDISGLVCNKEFRTVTEFYTEKDGKGERLVMTSLQLRDLPCEDTTRKP
jgi:M6 family metalloprotease-like protein